LDKLKYILEGWTNYTFKSETVELLAKDKATICATCENARISIWDDVLPDATLKEVEGMVCGICNCPLSTLLRSAKPCKLGKF